MISRAFAAVTVLAAAGPGCSGSPTGANYAPDLPSAWANAVTNPFFPLAPGTVYQYQSQTSGGLETNTVEVLATTRLVNGVTATIVRDQVFLDGELAEDTDDWFAQDTAGNVWYLGEDSKEIENGQVVSTHGSWEWGVNGALPGIIMWADPEAHMGEAYRQEFYRGVAEDWGRVAESGKSVSVPAGSFTGCIKTADWSALESGQESKYYCPQIGLVLEVGGGERLELMSQSLPAAVPGGTSNPSMRRQ